MRNLSRLILLSAFAPVAHAQSTLHTFDGDATHDLFGVSVSGAGDVNGDGHDDLISGAPFAMGNNRGSARVSSGADGSILYTFYGDSGYDYFGVSVSGAGDVNGDGYADVIVGAHQDDDGGTDSGSARVFSGLDGSILYTFHGDSPYDRTGSSVGSAGDVNGDGYCDLIVGTPVTGGHYARVYSGLDGTILHTLTGDPSGEDGYGVSVSGAGDIDGDGYDDVIVGAYVDDKNGKNAGSAKVYSGLDGSVLLAFVGDSEFDLFGVSVSGAGDVNADGHPDLIVGAYLDDNNGPASGRATVFSGLDGSILYTFDGDSSEDSFGGSVSGAGDVNGDGFDDLIVGAEYDDNNGGHSGSARVFSGRDGSILYTVDGDSAADGFGVSVSGAGDVNGDGYPDVIVGAPGDDNSGDESGIARVFSGCDGLGTNYCSPAVPNSSGQSAVISACGSDLANGGYFMLHATDLPAGRFGYFLTSQTQGFLANPGGSQGNLCLGGQVAHLRRQVQRSGVSGKLAIQVDLANLPTTPPHAVVAGETWNFQAWFRDENPGATSNFTDAIAVTFR